MSVERTRYGWRSTVRIPDTKTGKLKLRRKTFSESKFGRSAERKAHAWEERILSEREDMRAGIVIDDPSRRTIEGAALEYFQSSDFIKLKPRGKIRVEQLIRQFLVWNEVHGKPYADQFTRLDADRYKLHVMKFSRGRGVQRRLLEANKILRRVGNNSFGVVPRGASGRTTVRAFEDGELEALQSVMSAFELAVSKVLVNTGMRTGEFQNLRWTRIKPASLIIEGIEGWGTKSGKSRSVPINKGAREGLEYLRSVRVDEYVIPRVITSQDQHWFIRKFFNAIRKRTSTAFPALRDVLYEKDPENGRYLLTCHNYRKTFATRLYRKGTPVQFIQKLLGHASIATTELYLADVLTENLEAAVASLD